MTQETLTKLLHAAQQLTPEEQTALITQLTLLQRERLRWQVSAETGSSMEGEKVLHGWQ